MRNFRKILSFSLAALITLSMFAAPAMVSAAGSAAGTVLLSEDFGDSAATPPDAGSAILAKWNNWTNRDYYTGSNPVIITEDTIRKDGSNCVAEIKRKAHTSVSGIKSQFMRHAVNFPANTELAKISFKMRRTSANAKALNLLFVGADKDGNGSSTSGGFYLISDTYSTSSTIDSSRLMAWGTNGANGSTIATLKASEGNQTFYTVNQWYDFDVILNQTAKTISISVDDHVILADYAWASANIYGLPQYIDFGMMYYAYNESANTNARGSVSDYTKEAAYQLDDIVVTSYTAEDLAAMAEQEVDAALAKLSDAAEIKTAENLTLPTASELGTTAAVTWSSSDTSVLADDGTITKKQTDQTATLAATISSGSVQKTKVFNVTVLPDNVYLYESFHSVTTRSGAKLEGYNGWQGGTEYPGYTVDSVFTAQKEEGTENYYGSLHRTRSEATQGGYQSRYWALTKSVSPAAAEGASLSFRLKRDSNGRQFIVETGNLKINNQSTITINTDNHSAVIGGASYYYDAARMNGWLDFELVYSNGTVMMYENDKALTTAQGASMPKITASGSISSVSFATGRATASLDGGATTFMLDDVCVKALSADEIACIATKEKLAAAMGAIANPYSGDRIELMTADDENGAAVTWTSSDESVVSSNGEVIRPDVTATTPVTLTAKVTKGSANVEAVFTINVAPKYLSRITKISLEQTTGAVSGVYIENFADIAVPLVAVAVYSADGNDELHLKNVGFADMTAQANENTNKKGNQIAYFSDASLKVGTGDVVKVFLLNSSSELRPVAKSYRHDTYTAEE